MAQVIHLNDDESFESYAEYDDYSNDDDEGFFDSGLKAVGSLLSGNPVGAIKNAGSAIGSILGVQTAPASTSGIQSQSNLSGQVQTAGGRQVPIKLPETVATKQDVNILQTAIQKINGEIKKVADTTTTNGVALTKLSKEVKAIDEKHVSVSKKQNDLISSLGKDIKNMKSQEQMNMMLSMFIQPKLESVKFKETGTTVSLTDGTFHDIDSKSTDNTMLMLLMTMMGGEGGSGGFGDMGNNPMMMYFMMQAFNK